MTYLVDGPIGRDSAYHDAFDRMRVSEPAGLFDSQHQYDESPLFWVEKTTGTASSAHDNTNAATNLTVGAAANDEIIRQTRQYIRYQPGKSQLVLVTFDMGTLAGNHLRARFGYFDASNGVFLDQYNGTTSLCLRRAAADTAVAQSSWNVDTFDGNGPSGVTLDMTKAQILVMDFEWLGVGRVRVGFVVDGIIYYAHYFTHANVGSGTYMTTANLPIRAEFTNVDSGTGDTIKQICAAVISEGGFETERGIPFSANTGVSGVTVGTTLIPLLSIRPKTTFNSIENRGTILPTQIDALVDDQNARIDLIYNGSLTGASFASADGSSIAEVDTSASSISGGITVFSTYVPAASQGNRSFGGSASNALLSRLPLSLDVDGANPLPLTVCAVCAAAGGNVDVALTWQEFR